MSTMVHEHVATNDQARNRNALGRGLLAVALAASLAGCEGNGFGGLDGSSKPAAAEYKLDVDCAANPDASATQRIIQTKGVHVIMASVTGADYKDKWRVQIFPPQSDLMVTRPDGSDPSFVVHPDALATGKPQLVRLPHGVLVMQQTAESATVAPSVVPSASAEPSPSMEATPATGPQLDFTLGCQVPDMPMSTASPRQ